MTTEYQKLRSDREAGRVPEGQKGPRRKRFSPEVAKARQAEATRRAVEARRRATMILGLRYPDEYEVLLKSERAGVDAERGPLPGDEDPDAKPA